MNVTWDTDIAETETFGASAADLHAAANRILAQPVVDYDAYDRVFAEAQAQAARESEQTVNQARRVVDLGQMMAGYLGCVCLLLYAATERYGWLATATALGVLAVLFYGTLVVTAKPGPDDEEGEGNQDGV